MKSQFKFRVIVFLGILGFGVQSWSSTVGISTHPFQADEKLLTAEIGNDFSGATSSLVDVSYFHNITDRWNAQAGFAVGDGERSSRAHIASTLELFPDAGTQPQIATKFFAERWRENKQTVDTFGFAPIISKGFSFWGHPGYPYFSIPVRLRLENESQRFDTTYGATFGMTSPLHLRGFENVLASGEVNINLNDDISYMLLGLSMKFQ